MCRQTQMCRAMVGAATWWEHVGGARASRISGLQTLFASTLPEGKLANFVLAGVFVNTVKCASWSPSQEACSAFLARRWQHLYCEQVLRECACEHMCHTCVQAYSSLASSFGESGAAAGRVWSSMGCICWERPYRHRLLQVSVAENLGAGG